MVDHAEQLADLEALLDRAETDVVFLSRENDRLSGLLTRAFDAFETAQTAFERLLHEFGS